MYSFDATFSKRGPDGEPLHLFNWDTGKVDPTVAASWEKYDLSRQIAKLDKKQKEALQSKIHIYVNEQDLFGLDEPVKRFRDRLMREGIDADIQIFSAAGHDVWTDSLRKEIHEDMDSKLSVISH